MRTNVFKHFAGFTETASNHWFTLSINGVDLSALTLTHLGFFFEYALIKCDISQFLRMTPGVNGVHWWNEFMFFSFWYILCDTHSIKF